MANKYMLDSSAWIEYFIGSETGAKVRNIVENHATTTCILSAAEISDKFSGEKEKFEEFLGFINNRSSIAGLTLSACAQSGKLKADRRKVRKEFGLLDAIIYLTAKENSCILVTKDNDFKGMENVELV